MRKPVSANHPLRLLFDESVGKALRGKPDCDEQIRGYLTGLLMRFLHTDGVFRIRSSNGEPVSTVLEMLGEADVRLGADSFEREREVHRHVGDYILFWSGVHPKFLSGTDLLGGLVACDYLDQGRRSYRIVSAFDYPPYEREALLFELLSERFEVYSGALRVVSEELPFSMGDSAA